MLAVVVLTALVVGGAVTAGVLVSGNGHATAAGHRPPSKQPARVPRSARSTTTTTAPPPSTTQPTVVVPGVMSIRLGPTTSPPLPQPGPGFVPGHVTAVGDSVMIDYQDPLEQDIPGITVEAAVGRQWSDGEAILQQAKAAGSLGAVVVVGLGTNGPITESDFNDMMSILSGASRVVFVTVHVDQPWQDQVNQVLTSGVARYPHTAVLVDWTSLADQYPSWVYSDETHLPIDGTGAQVLAATIAGSI
ncbi:MAG TPA: hypothetical protein VK277_08610 [Acidimicrobiales bacterium]|nr:hypothetical protein [Acidimicrobiales bacterium]